MVCPNSRIISFSARINCKNSIFTSEVLAIDKALTTILHKEVSNAVIATDSFSVSQVLQRQGQHNIRHHIIGQIRQKIVAIYKRGYNINPLMRILPESV